MDDNTKAYLASKLNGQQAAPTLLLMNLEGAGGAQNNNLADLYAAYKRATAPPPMPTISFDTTNMANSNGSTANTAINVNG